MTHLELRLQITDSPVHSPYTMKTKESESSICLNLLTLNSCLPQSYKPIFIHKSVHLYNLCHAFIPPFLLLRYSSSIFSDSQNIIIFK